MQPMTKLNRNYEIIDLDNPFWIIFKNNLFFKSPIVFLSGVN